MKIFIWEWNTYIHSDRKALIFCSNVKPWFDGQVDALLQEIAASMPKKLKGYYFIYVYALVTNTFDRFYLTIYIHYSFYLNNIQIMDFVALYTFLVFKHFEL